MDDEKEGYWIALKLANFNLVVDGQRLLMTTKKKQHLEKVLQHFQELNPQRQYLVQSFAVKVLHRNRDGDVFEWEKIEGFSLWEILF